MQRIENFILFLAVNKFENRLRFNKVIAKKARGSHFFGPLSTLETSVCCLGLGLLTASQRDGHADNSEIHDVVVAADDKRARSEADGRGDRWSQHQQLYSSMLYTATCLSSWWSLPTRHGQV